MQDEFEKLDPFFAHDEEEGDEHPKKIVSDEEWAEDADEDEDDDTDTKVDEEEEE
jgi:hypothetical protein